MNSDRPEAPGRVTAPWRTLRVASGYGERGRAVPVEVGLVGTAAGETHLALRVDGGELVILPRRAGAELAENLRAALAEFPEPGGRAEP